MQNWNQTILSQYAASPTINAIVQSLNDAIDPSADIVNFYNNVWNIKTAQGNGLDIWGQILGVQRNLAIPSTNYFGFEEAVSGTTGSQPFNQAPFFSGVAATSNYAMSDTQFRQCLMVKAAANISDLSIKSINALLQAQFGVNNGTDPYGQAYIQDTGGMAFVYYLNFAPSAGQIALVNSSGVFPRPAGVAVTLSHL